MKKNIWLNVALLAIFILDRILKQMALRGFVFKTPFFEFSYFSNVNVALGIPLKGNFLYFLLIFIIIVVTAMLSYAYKKKKTMEVFSWTMILIGAFSNLLDRLECGSVTDYLNFPLFTALNLADVMIFSGVIILLIGLFPINSRPENSERPGR